MSLRDWPILRQLSPKFLASVRIAFVFGSKGNEALIITADDNVYGVGSNTSSCLGIEKLPSSSLPSLNSVLSDQNVDGFTCGGDAVKRIFVVARLQNGEIYQWGLLNETRVTPERVEFNVEVPVKVKSVACGSFHCMIVSDDGRVFTWGKNDKGQLGFDGNNTSNRTITNTPCQVRGAIEGKVVTEISCGAQSSVVILEDGKVFSWGSNSSGQLGNNDPHLSLSMVPVELKLKIPKDVDVIFEKIACGPAHVLALSTNHQVYVWGSNNCSQLGSSDPKVGICFPRPVKFGNNLRFVDICASNVCDLSVARCESGEIYMWGKTSSGQIIVEPTDSQCESIHQVFAFYASPNVMPKPLRQILKANRRTMSTSLDKEFGNQETSDLTILVDNREIYVHQTILKIKSTYFRTMLSRWLEEGQRVLTIREKSFTALEAYLKYLYTDKLEVHLELAFELWQLGDEYADENFKLLCEQSIKRDITADTVAELFARNRQLETCQELNSFFLNYALKHAKKVVRSEGFQKWDLDTLKTFTIGLAEMKKTDNPSYSF